MCFDKNDLIVESLNTEEEEKKKKEEEDSSYEDSDDETSELTESMSKGDGLSGDENRS